MKKLLILFLFLPFLKVYSYADECIPYNGGTLNLISIKASTVTTGGYMSERYCDTLLNNYPYGMQYIKCLGGHPDRSDLFFYEGWSYDTTSCELPPACTETESQNSDCSCKTSFQDIDGVCTFFPVCPVETILNTSQDGCIGNPDLQGNCSLGFIDSGSGCRCPQYTAVTTDENNNFVCPTLNPLFIEEQEYFNADGNTTVTNTDGSTTVTQPDGTATITQPDGTVTTIEPYGDTTVTNTDGSTTVTQPDGTVINTSSNGTVTTTEPNFSTSTDTSTIENKLTTISNNNSIYYTSSLGKLEQINNSINEQTTHLDSSLEGIKDTMKSEEILDYLSQDIQGELDSIKADSETETESAFTEIGNKISDIIPTYTSDYIGSVSSCGSFYLPNQSFSLLGGSSSFDMSSVNNLMNSNDADMLFNLMKIFLYFYVALSSFKIFVKVG